MRRTYAYLLIVGMLLAVAAYLCWAARPFLIRPGMTFEADVSPKEKAIVLAWKKETGGYGPERFRWDRFLNLLIHPYEKGIIPAVVSFKERDSYTPEHVVVIKHPHKIYTVRITVDRRDSETCVTYH